MSNFAEHQRLDEVNCSGESGTAEALRAVGWGRRCLREDFQLEDKSLLRNCHTHGALFILGLPLKQRQPFYLCYSLYKYILMHTCVKLKVHGLHDHSPGEDGVQGSVQPPHRSPRPHTLCSGLRGTSRLVGLLKKTGHFQVIFSLKC